MLSHHQVTNTVKSTGQKITLDAFAHVEYEGDRICFFHINIKAPEGVDMKAMFAEMIKQ